MNNLYIKQKYLNELITIFDNYCPKSTVYAYGSRLNGTAHEGSDLDLAILNFKSEGYSLSKLKNLLLNSNIPFLIDIVEYDNLPQSFKNEILKNYITLYPKS